MDYSSVQDIIRDLKTNPIESGGHVYHPIPFAEFQNLKTSSNIDEVYKKWGLIENYITEITSNNWQNLKVLDIGANAGFYTFNMAIKGAKVTAFEPHPRYGPIGKFLTKEKKLNVQWYANPFEFKLIQHEHFTIALMLSVFQWMAAGGERMAEACINLKYISSVCDYLFFELGYNKGASSINTKRLNHYAELIRFLNKHTEYEYFKLIGTTRLWKSTRRYLVLCSNDRHYEDSFFLRYIRKINI